MMDKEKKNTTDKMKCTADVPRILKQLLCVSVMVFAICLTWSICVMAGTGTIKGTNVNVRSDAGVSFTKITSLNNGDVTIVNGSKKDANGKTWYQVTFTKDGKEYTGYIIEDYLTVSGETASAADDSQSAQQTNSKKKTQRYATVKASRVNVRKKTVTGTIIGRVDKGDSVIVIRNKKGKDGKKWFYISFNNNGALQKGWIRYDFIKLGKKVNAVDTIEVDQTDNAQEEVSEVPNIATVTEYTPDLPGISEDAKTYANIKKDNVNVRKKTVSGKVVGTLKKGDIVGVIRNKKGKDGKKWYYISFAKDGEIQKGWVRYDYVKLRKRIKRTNDSSNNTDAVPQLSAEEFEAYMTQQGFPEDYKVALRSLHTKYPKWTFRAVQTGLNWNDVIAAETKVGLNLVSKNAVASWKSTVSTAYDWKKNIWFTFDGGSWVAASDALTAYYIDPRNFLDENSIFQFESLEYEQYQAEAGVKELLKSSFMNADYTEPDGSVKSYAQSFVEIGKAVGVSPYHLAARCYQEQGKGTSASISGTVKGYENIFNYYNIGAYASGKNSPTTQGLIYASSTSTSESLNYDRPWNTRYKSLLGGAKYVAAKYVKVGQNTLYFQKFNVVNTKNGIYKHQYMTNVQAAAAEAVKMSKAYVDKNTELVFYIPVYNGMPQAISEKPTHNLNPNNYLATLSVDGCSLVPVFDGAVEQYDVTVDADVSEVTVSATAVAATSTISGTGLISLSQGRNDVTVQCTSQSGQVKNYVLHITKP